jgi:hypothetical protein
MNYVSRVAQSCWCCGALTLFALARQKPPLNVTQLGGLSLIIRTGFTGSHLSCIPSKQWEDLGFPRSCKPKCYLLSIVFGVGIPQISVLGHTSETAH